MSLDVYANLMKLWIADGELRVNYFAMLSRVLRYLNNVSLLVIMRSIRNSMLQFIFIVV